MLRAVFTVPVDNLYQDDEHKTRGESWTISLPIMANKYNNNNDNNSWKPSLKLSPCLRIKQYINIVQTLRHLEIRVLWIYCFVGRFAVWSTCLHFSWLTLISFSGKFALPSLILKLAGERETYKTNFCRFARKSTPLSTKVKLVKFSCFFFFFKHT